MSLPIPTTDFFLSFSFAFASSCSYSFFVSFFSFNCSLGSTSHSFSYSFIHPLFLVISILLTLLFLILLFKSSFFFFSTIFFTILWFLLFYLMHSSLFSSLPSLTFTSYYIPSSFCFPSRTHPFLFFKATARGRKILIRKVIYNNFPLHFILLSPHRPFCLHFSLTNSKMNILFHTLFEEQNVREEQEGSLTQTTQWYTTWELNNEIITWRKTQQDKKKWLSGAVNTGNSTGRGTQHWAH